MPPFGQVRARAARLGFALGLAAAPAAALEISGDGETDYQACVEAAWSEPGAALEFAVGWEGLGGGLPAKQCQAIALYELKQYAAAGHLLEDIAEAVQGRNEDAFRDALVFAGQAWFEARDLKRAYGLQTAALGVSPEDPDILTDRAVTLASGGAYWEALDDLNTALEGRPERADIFALRAAVYRALEAYDLAIEDIQQAIELDPARPESYLERGNLRLLSEDLDGAREDWLTVLDLAPSDGQEPTGPAARAARANLERLDVEAEPLPEDFPAEEAPAAEAAPPTEAAPATEAPEPEAAPEPPETPAESLVPETAPEPTPEPSASGLPDAAPDETSDAEPAEASLGALANVAVPLPKPRPLMLAEVPVPRPRPE